jgi:hypothetical protein
MGTLQYRKRICRSEAGRRASVLSNRIGLESQEVEIQRRVEIRCKVPGCLLAGVWRVETSLEAFTKGFGYTCVCDAGSGS